MPLAAITSITCPRVLVRPVAETDLPDLYEINGDDEVTCFLPYATWRTREDGLSWLARMAALGDAGSGRQLVIERRADGRVVGTVLLFRHEEASARAEIGYVVGRAYWRQGYAREALAGVLEHAFTTLGLRRIEAEVDPANTASNQLLLALGFVREGLLRQRWMAKGRTYDTKLYGLLADEWHGPSVVDAAGVGEAATMRRQRTQAPAAVPLPDLVVRAAVPEDALCLSVLATQVFLDTYATHGIRDAIAREVGAVCSEALFRNAIAGTGEHVLVAELGGHLVGFAHVAPGAQHPLAPAGTQAELLRLYVQEGHAGRQVGSRLLLAAEQLSAAAGANVLWLKTWAYNHRALAFYAARGYADHGVTAYTFEGESHENRVYARSLALPRGG